jgi:hypothetical protein
MGTMALNRMRTWLAAGVLVTLLSAPGLASDPVESDMELFAPAETEGFGGGVRANEGFFATLDFIQWTISKPYTTDFGYGGPPRQVYLDAANYYFQSNSLNTSFIDSENTLGERFELGSIDDGEGFMASGWYLHTQSENFTFTGTQMNFNAPPIPGMVNASPPGVADLLQGYVDTVGGNIRDLPVVFDTLEVKNAASAYRIDLDYIHRMTPTEHWGTFEWYFGGGYMNFDEQFDVTAPSVEPVPANPPTAAAPTPGGILNDSRWYTHAINNIFGPEFKLRWFRTYDHWTWDAQAGFMAAYNRQNINQTGVFAEEADDATSAYFHGNVGQGLYLTSTSFQNSVVLSEFSPVADFNANIKYAVTRAVSVRVGYSFLWAGNIARPVDMVNYEIGTGPGQKMGIIAANNKQDVFIQGWNIGVELNR